MAHSHNQGVPGYNSTSEGSCLNTCHVCRQTSLWSLPRLLPGKVGASTRCCSERPCTPVLRNSTGHVERSSRSDQDSQRWWYLENLISLCQAWVPYIKSRSDPDTQPWWHLQNLISPARREDVGQCFIATMKLPLSFLVASSSNIHCDFYIHPWLNARMASYRVIHAGVC